MRHLIWRPRALESVDAIVDFIGQRNPAAAARMRVLFEDGGQRALALPFAYRKGRVTGTREVVLHPNYILVFRIDDDAVEIINLLHARQHYP